MVNSFNTGEYGTCPGKWSLHDPDWHDSISGMVSDTISGDHWLAPELELRYVLGSIL